MKKATYSFNSVDGLSYLSNISYIRQKTNASTLSIFKQYEIDIPLCMICQG